ncbi:MAG: hypothetical protein WAT79_12860 [Saprospiraceae bacterium]
MIEKIKYQLGNLPGFRTKRKIVVIESDDWGSIRLPSREIYKDLIKQGIPLDKATYNRYDALASEEDLSALFEVLSSFSDKNGNPVKITANTIVANPDFEKIESSDFKEYFYEPFTDTLNRYPAHKNAFKLWQEGIQAGVFKPQFHGREHINVQRWMKALANENSMARKIFKYKMYDLSIGLERNEVAFMEALQIDGQNDIHFQTQYLREGLSLFEQIFKYKSKTFIAPCYVWHSDLHRVLYDSGVTTLQGSWYQLEPNILDNSLKKIFHYTGQKNKLNQIFLTRNVYFEPFEIKINDWNKEVLNKMKLAFNVGKPAIIQSHRVNYIGYIDKTNRDSNLKKLRSLIPEILKTWPDVEFMSSDELNDVILKNQPIP